MDYTSRNHSKYSLMAHLIFVCKYRKPLMAKLGNEIKTILYAVAEGHDIAIIEMESDKDHVHID
jgi:putative transposase